MLRSPAATHRTTECRFCGAQSRYTFSKRVLTRYDVAYFQCEACSSRQTEIPYWLDEAYAVPGVHIDVGSASRTVKNWLGASLLLDQLGVARAAKAVDFGSGSGLFVRLMRDVGYDFHACDKYTIPRLCNYFLADTLSGAKVLTAFEVFEHLPEPKQTLHEFFSVGADFILFTTWFCDGQSDDWIYYLPECGQHVFFCSEAAMRQVALSYGYDMTISHFFMILAKHDRMSAAQRETIHEFSLTSMAQALSGARDRLSGVIMGNEHIDRDLAAARVRFTREREDESRATRTGATTD